MTPPTAPAPSPASPALAEVLRALGAVLAEERRAIARLDVEAIEALTARKQAIVDDLARLHATGATPAPADVHAITAARIELGVSAALVGTALAAVAAVLGYEDDGRYDRQARCQARTRPLRMIAL